MPSGGPVRPVIALNALALRPQGSGVQTYVRQMLIHLPAACPEVQFRAVVQEDASALVPEGIEAVTRPNSSRLRRAFDGMRSLGSADIVHGLDVDVPLRPGAPVVTTVHDLSVFDVPWTFDALRARGERWLVRRSLAKADRVVAVSEFTAERIHSLFGRTSVVIPEAARPGMVPSDEAEIAQIRERYGLPAAFVLYVGNIEPRKGVAGLAGACRSAGLNLVVAGRSVGASPPSGAQHLGYVPDHDLPALYGAASIFAYPSHYEGFGLPPLEAMACGAPVVVSRIPPLEEVVGGAGCLVEPGDEAKWASALAEISADAARRTEMSRAGLVRSGEFSWVRTARSTAEVYTELRPLSQDGPGSQ